MLRPPRRNQYEISGLIPSPITSAYLAAISSQEQAILKNQEPYDQLYLCSIIFFN